MHAKAPILWQRLRDSLWLLPSLLTLGAVALAAATVEFDRQMLANERADLYLAFGGGAEGARGVLTAIGSTVITVTGVIFSVTIVALQLASSQFTPLVLRSFLGDRANQLVLGVFIATFTYTLLVLRTVRSATQDNQVFVPSISVAVAIGLALVSIGLLIYFIHHVSRSIQAAVIIDRATRDTRQVVDRLFPREADTSDSQRLAHEPATPPMIVAADRAGYIQAVDEDALVDLARQHRLTIRMDRRVGEHLLPGVAVASVWSASEMPDATADGVRQAFVLGPERTLTDDLELGIRQLSDIALRALSPSLNDPTTAMICFDRLAEMVVLVGCRLTPAAVRGPDGACLIARRQTFDDVAETAYGLTRRSVAADPTVAHHVAVTLGTVGGLVRPQHRPVLAAHLDALLAAVDAATTLAHDLEPIRRAGQDARRILTEATPPVHRAARSGSSNERPGGRSHATR